MFCTKCGTKNDDAARFCVACGAATGLAGPATAGFGPADTSGGMVGVIPARRRLFRIRSQKKLAGVCAGFAEYFDMDVTLVRLIWVVLALVPPSIGLIGYIIAWVVLPVEETGLNERA